MEGDTGSSGGGDTESDSSCDGSSDDDFGRFWDKLTGIGDTVSDTFQKVQNLPSLIGDALKGFFEDVVDAIDSLPTTIFEGIKGIFVPDAVQLQEGFNDFLNHLKSKFNFNTDFFESALTGDGKPVADVESDYNIPGVGTMKLKFFDASYLVQGVEYFRPFIRGFLVLLMGLYHIKQILGFIGQDGGVNAGHAEEKAREVRDSRKK